MIAIVTTTWEVLTQRQWEPFGAVAVMHCSWMYLFVNIVIYWQCCHVMSFCVSTIEMRRYSRRSGGDPSAHSHARGMSLS